MFKPLILPLLLANTIFYTIADKPQLSLMKSDIVHTSSGLIMHYTSDYRPTNRVITFSVTIPMVDDMCYLIPPKAIKKIPRCRAQMRWNATSETRKKDLELIYRRLTGTATAKPRNKRIIPAIIPIGMGIAALALSAVNVIQSISLKSEVNAVSQALQTMVKENEHRNARISHLREGQFKLALELSQTQNALNKTIEMVNEHSAVLRTHELALQAYSARQVYANNRFEELIHAVETHFIHTSIEDILSNKLNLLFIHHKDMTKTVELITRELNITLDDLGSSSIPMIELITRLLVQQQIDFIPTGNERKIGSSKTIGNLVFTSYFAAPKIDQNPYFVFELIPIPFSHKGHRVRLSQIPAYIGIEPNTLQFIRWTQAEALSCNFQEMPTCRETPAIRKNLIDTCLHQILTDSPLTSCRTEVYEDPVFIRRVGRHWAVSTINHTKCHTVNNLDTEQHRIFDNEQITLPPVALVTVIDTNSLSCDQFHLPGLPIKVGSPISVLQNSTITALDKELVDLHSIIGNNTNWAKLPYIPPNLQATMDFISKEPQVDKKLDHKEWLQHPFSIGTGVVVIMGLILIGILVYCFFARRSKVPDVNISLPTISMSMLKPA